MSEHLCECGCGLPAPLAKTTSRKAGRAKGQPQRFVNGHVLLRRNAATPEQRFWECVTKGDPSECWVWKGKISKGGYGYFYAQSKLFRAHRFSYEFHIAPIPEGLLICHHCDNRPCCNPNHLFVGTHADNNWDRIAKGR